MMNSNRQCGAIGTPSPATKAQMELLTTWPVFDPLVAEEMAFANARSHAGTVLRKPAMTPRAASKTGENSLPNRSLTLALRGSSLSAPEGSG